MQMSVCAQYSLGAGAAADVCCARDAVNPVSGLELSIEAISVVMRTDFAGLDGLEKCNGSISASHKGKPRRSLKTYVKSEVKWVN